MSDFTRFRADETETKPKPKRKETTPVEVLWSKSDLLMCVDQALAKSGYVIVRGDLVVVMVGKLSKDGDTVLDGHEAMLKRSVELERDAEQVIKEYKPDVVIHEQPPVRAFGNNNQSSLVAATAWRIAAAKAKVIVKMVGSQKGKKAVTGNGNAKKPEVHRRLKQAIAEGRIKVIAPNVRWNQDNLDALALAVAELGGF